MRQQHKSLALSYLRSRKLLEEVLAQRLGSLEILQSTLLRVEATTEDIRVPPHLPHFVLLIPLAVPRRS